MNNENGMEKLLKQKGFSKVKNTNEWVRGTWTIRLFDKQVEAFQDMSTHNYKYVCLPLSEENLKDILEDIE